MKCKKCQEPTKEKEWCHTEVLHDKISFGGRPTNDQNLYYCKKESNSKNWYKHDYDLENIKQ